MLLTNNVLTPTTWISTWYMTSWKRTGKVSAASSSSFKLQWTRVSSCRRKTIHENLCQNESLVMEAALLWCSRLTRSSTRENSGVLRVFRGSAGLRVSCSSVSGGTCLMKKYLKNISTYMNAWKKPCDKY